LAGLARFYGWAKAEVEQLTIDEVRFWNQAAADLNDIKRGG
jgi:hypothetical protein